MHFKLVAITLAVNRSVSMTRWLALSVAAEKDSNCWMTVFPVKVRNLFFKTSPVLHKGSSKPVRDYYGNYNKTSQLFTLTRISSVHRTDFLQALYGFTGKILVKML